MEPLAEVTNELSQREVSETRVGPSSQVGKYGVGGWLVLTQAELNQTVHGCKCEENGFEQHRRASYDHVQASNEVKLTTMLSREVHSRAPPQILVPGGDIWVVDMTGLEVANLCHTLYR